ncbi:hypothetical protein OIE63_09425 [Streptomyces sp. NBC_01795]|uniref:hypothetical protein n=1 Tax=Streptomyces sp. NBC_01795 TaxID=2975943 RepID=UPI002DD87493|nr:hypothetical protein [Streptomyces sp. NBC_01795]WSA91757.1 hypothetical protein OIE63_09425 [Streptomyces sp. NBC_01795]
MGDPAAEKGDDKLPDLVIGPPIPPGEESALEPPREEGDRFPLQPAPPLGPPPLKVSHKVLESGATSASEIHSAFYKAAASLEGTTNTAKAEFEGWTTADGLEKSHEQWEIQASNVAAWLAKIEQSLRDAKKAYQTQDFDTGLDVGSVAPKGEGVPYGPKVPFAPRRSAIEGIG